MLDDGVFIYFWALASFSSAKNENAQGIFSRTHRNETRKNSDTRPQVIKIKYIASVVVVLVYFITLLIALLKIHSKCSCLSSCWNIFIARAYESTRAKQHKYIYYYFMNNRSESELKNKKFINSNASLKFLPIKA